MGARRVTRGFVVWIGPLLALSLAPAVALADREFFSVRNYNPFAQVFGLPGFADATVLDSQQTSLALNTTVINHSAIDSVPAESIFLDGETCITNLAVGFGFSDRLTLGIDVPLVAYSGGVFDSAIEAWHDLWGFSNGFRDGLNNELFMGYARNGADQFVLDSSSSGIGDVRLQAAYRLAESAEADFGVVLRAGVKLPTGDARNLRGSEASDFSLDLAVRKELDLSGSQLMLVAHAGALILGAGEVLPQLQRDMVGFAGAGAVWRLNERWRINLQVYAQSSYFDTDLKALGSDSLSLTVGGSYTWVERAMRLSVGVVEDPLNDITPDVALHIELTKDFH